MGDWRGLSLYGTCCYVIGCCLLNFASAMGLFQVSSHWGIVHQTSGRSVGFFLNHPAIIHSFIRHQNWRRISNLKLLCSFAPRGEKEHFAMLFKSASCARLCVFDAFFLLALAASNTLILGITPYSPCHIYVCSVSSAKLNKIIISWRQCN